MQQLNKPIPQSDALLEAVLDGMRKVAEIPAVVAALTAGWLDVDRQNRIVTFYLPSFWIEHFAKSEVKRQWLSDCVKAALRPEFTYKMMPSMGKASPARPLAQHDDDVTWSALIDAVKKRSRLLAAYLEQGSRLDIYEHHKVVRVVLSKPGYHEVLRNPAKRDILIAEVQGILGEDFQVLLTTAERNDVAGSKTETPQAVVQSHRQLPRTFDEARQQREDGTPFWDARDLAVLMGYEGLTEFAIAIEKSRATYEQAGLDVSDHIQEAPANAASGQPKTIHLSEVACYLAVQAADTRIKKVAEGQVYFAQTILQQRNLNQVDKDLRRLDLRDRLTKLNNKASRILFTKGAGDGIRRFYDAGHRAMYGMGLEEIRKRKGLEPNDNLYDFAGETELWANGFRASMATDDLERYATLTPELAARINSEAGTIVREALAKKGVQNLPENLKLTENIREVHKRVSNVEGSRSLPLLPDVDG